ncbi:MAG: hypothetical protein CYG61_00630, partial [Actinobacteria bacterium]
GVLAELGLSGRAAAFTAAGTGLAAAYVLGRQARRREDLSLAFLAAGCAAVGVGTAWSGAEVGRMADMVALGAAFLIVEVAALAAIRDAFWRRPAAGLAGVAEVLAGVATMSLAFGLLIAPLVFSLGGSDAGRPAVGLAAALVAAGWLASGLRGSLGSGPAAERTVALDGFLQQERNTCLLPAAVAAVAAVQSGTGSPMATSAGLLVVAVALLATRAASSLATAAAFAVWAPVVVLDDPWRGCCSGSLVPPWPARWRCSPPAAAHARWARSCRPSPRWRAWPSPAPTPRMWPLPSPSPSAPWQPAGRWPSSSTVAAPSWATWGGSPPLFPSSSSACTVAAPLTCSPWPPPWPPC